jgi:hypothetical protein
VAFTDLTGNEDWLAASAAHSSALVVVAPDGTIDPTMWA